MFFFKLADTALDKMSSWGLVLSLFLMLSLSVMTIVFRWMETSYVWMEPAVRHLVFISTFLGGVVATGRGTHIGIDILERFLEVRKLENFKLWLTRFISLIACGVLLWLVKASWTFMNIEFEYGRQAFLNIHSGYLVGIIPVGFGLIALRFLFVFVLSFEPKESQEVS